MDTLSHTLWGKGLFGYRKYGALALLFGALPDLLSFGLYSLIRLLSQGINIQFGRPAVIQSLIGFLQCIIFLIA